MACSYPRCECMHGPEDCIFGSAYVTDPTHGGKVTCHECNGFIQVFEAEGYWDNQHKDEFPKAWFHKRCYNRYKHYYGLDKPID